MENTEEERVSPLLLSLQETLTLLSTQSRVCLTERGGTTSPGSGGCLSEVPYHQRLAAGTCYHFWCKVGLNMCSSCGIAQSCSNRSPGSCFWSKQWVCATVVVLRANSVNTPGGVLMRMSCSSLGPASPRRCTPGQVEGWNLEIWRNILVDASVQFIPCKAGVREMTS